MKKILFLLLLSGSVLSAQQKNDSIKKSDSIYRKGLLNEIKILQKKLDSVKKIQKKEKEELVKEWTVDGRFFYQLDSRRRK